MFGGWVHQGKYMRDAKLSKENLEDFYFMMAHSPLPSPLRMLLMNVALFVAIL